MRQIIIAFLFFLLGYSSFGQVILDWAARFNSTNNQTEEGRAILTDASGNVYSAGFYQGASTDFDPGPAVYNLTLAPNTYGVYVSKLDANGNFLWVKGIVANGFVLVYSMTSDPSGNLCLTGTFQGTTDFDPGPSTFTIAPTNGDAYVLKLDANGNFIWVKRFGSGSNSTIGMSISTDGAGNIYSTGNFGGFLTDFDPGPGTYTMSPFGGQDIYVSKLNAAGNFIWAKHIGGTSYDNCRSIQSNATQVYISGEFQGTADLDPGPSAYTLTSSSGNQGYVLRLDSAGNFVWARPFAGGSTNVNGMQLNKGYIYNTGYFYNTVDFDPTPGTYTLAGGAGDAFSTKLDTAGNFYWAKAYGGVNQDYGFAITSDTAGNVFTAGEYSTYCDLDPGPGTYNVNTSGASELFLVKLDPVGNFVWGRTVPALNNTRPYSIAVDAGGSVYCTGMAIGICDFDPGPGTYTTGTGFSNDAFIFKWDQCALPSVPGAISGPVSLCSGTSAVIYSVAPVSGATSYSWNLPGIGWSGTSTTNTISLTAGSGSGNLSINANNACGSTTATVLSITVSTTPTVSVNSGFVCAGSSFTMSPGGASSYTFSSGSAVVTPTANTSYSVTGSNSSGCISANTAVANVTVNTIPNMPGPVNGTSVMCSNYGPAGYNVIPVSGATFYTWLLPPGWSGSSANNNIIATPGTTGFFTVTANNSCGNSSQQTLLVTVNPLPTVTANTSASIICGPPFQGTATITASGANTYVWNTTATTTTIAASPSITTVYTVTGTDANGCVNSTAFTQSVSTCTGINEQIINSELIIFPIPTSGVVTIKAKAGLQIHVYNVIGELILSTELKTETIELDLSNQANGIYFIRIGSITKKIIKE